MKKLDRIITREEDFAEWYTSIIHNAKLSLYTNIKGMMIFQPYAWSIWENIRDILDKQFKEKGIKNLAMPLLIPLADLEKEKDHIKGFSPEVYTITKIGNKEINEHYIIRPTSEIIFCEYFRNILNSYKDLPIKLNQWCSVLRAEKTTRPFLRNSEFYWQETHSIHIDEADALNFTEDMINTYEKFIEEDLLIPVIKGEKTLNERFAGANKTYTVEALMQDGQVLQCGTSHYLSDNFAKNFQIKFQNNNNEYEYVKQTSAGVSTRLIGAIIMVHADDKGLNLPWNIAPTQIILNLANSDEQVNKIAHKIKDSLEKYRVEIDNSDKGLGYKISNNEILGIPLQVIIGKKTISESIVTVYRRDLSQKEDIHLDELSDYLERVIVDIKESMFNKAKNHLDSSIEFISSIDELKTTLSKRKVAKAYFCGNEDDEIRIKEETKATPRCIIDNDIEGICFITNKKTKNMIIIARAY